MDASRSNIRVESAETGEVFTLRREPTIEQLKMELGLLQPISSGDQILLYGPPFKTFDSQYRPDMVLDNKRIFLFNRRIIADESLRPNFRPRSSQEPPQPEPISGTVDASHVLEVVKDEALVNKFVEYIQFFRSELHKNRFYENYVQQATLACKTTVARLKVQLDAIHAVSSNMLDVFNAAAKTHAALQVTYGQQQELHRHLLDNFETNLEQLKQIPLHPSFLQSYELYKAHYQAQQAQQAQQQQSQRGGDGSNAALSASWVTHHGQVSNSESHTNTSEIAFPPLQTLYDCIPVERERKFYQHCLDNHRQLSQQFTIVQANLSAVKYAVDNLAKVPVDSATVETWAKQLEREEDTYARGLEQLRSNYQMVYEALTQSIPQDAAALERLLAKCAERRHEYEATGLSTSTSTTATAAAPISASPSQRTWLEHDMKSTVQRLQSWQQTLEQQQEQVSRTLYTSVRQINAIHSDIQGKLRRDIELMKKLSSQGKNEYIVHLQSLAQLPRNYRALVDELTRRQRQTQRLQRQLQPAKRWLAQLRDREIVQREQFMREYGLHLPPIFLKLFPSLKDKPPSIPWEILQEESWWKTASDGDADGDGDAHEGDAAAGAAATGLDLDEDNPFRAAVDHEQQRREWQQERERYEQQTREKDDAIRQLQAQVEALQQRHQQAMQHSEQLQSQQEQLQSTMAQLEAAHRELQEKAAAAAAAAAAATAPPSQPQSLPQSQPFAVEDPASPSPPAPPAADPQLLQTPPSLQPETVDRSTERSELTASTHLPEAAHVWDEVVAYFKRALHERPLVKLMEESSISFDDVVARLPRHSVLADSTKIVDLATRLQVFVAQLKAMPTPTSTPNHPQQQQHSGIDSLNVSLGEDASPDDDEPLTGSASTLVEEDTETQKLMTSLHAVLSMTAYRLAYPVLAIMDFRVGDNVLFLPAKLLNGRQVWMAFNSGCPFHFLDELSLEAFVKRSKSTTAVRTSIIGRLIFIEHHVVPEGTDPRQHAYNLQPGTKYATCHIEPVFKPASSSKSSSSTSASSSASTAVSSSATATTTTAAVPSSPLAATTMPPTK